MTLEISKPLNIKTLAGYREKSRLRRRGEAAGHLYKENEDCRRGEKEVSIDDGSGSPVSGQKPPAYKSAHTRLYCHRKQVIMWLRKACDTLSFGLGGFFKKTCMTKEGSLDREPDATEAHRAHRGPGTIRCECWASTLRGPGSQEHYGVFSVLPGMAASSNISLVVYFAACLTFLFRKLKY